VKYNLLESVGKNFNANFVMKAFPADKQKHKCRVLTAEKSEDIGAIFEHTPRKSLKCLAQETGMSKPSARMSTQLLKLGPYKTTVIHALQPCDPAVGFYILLSKVRLICS
jgi:hypothetical protein